MKSISIQFHMLLSELIDFVSEVSKENNLSVELERWHPKVIRRVPNRANLADEFRSFGSVDRVWLLYSARDSRRVERFMLNVGTRRGNRLKQAHLGAGTEDIEAYAVLKKVAGALKRRTKAGIWIKTTAGNVGLSRTFRISPGAAEASRAGTVELVNVAFTQQMSADQPK